MHMEMMKTKGRISTPTNPSRAKAAKRDATPDGAPTSSCKSDRYKRSVSRLQQAASGGHDPSLDFSSINFAAWSDSLHWSNFGRNRRSVQKDQDPERPRQATYPLGW